MFPVYEEISTDPFAHTINFLSKFVLKWRFERVYEWHFQLNPDIAENQLVVYGKMARGGDYSWNINSLGLTAFRSLYVGLAENDYLNYGLQTLDRSRPRL